MHYSPNQSQSILFIGDSITDCDRREPVHAPLGRGYVRLINDFFIYRQPELHFSILNRGIGGNTVDDLQSRWQEDALLHRPDVLVMLIGMNDLNQFLCQPDKAHLSPEGFASIHDRLLIRARETLPDTRILVVSPFYLSLDTDSNSYRARVLRILPEYIEAGRVNASRYALPFVNLHEIFQSRLLVHHSDIYCTEPIHPNATGHLIIAETLYSALNA